MTVTSKCSNFFHRVETPFSKQLYHHLPAPPRALGERRARGAYASPLPTQCRHVYVGAKQTTAAGEYPFPTKTKAGKISVKWLCTMIQVQKRPLFLQELWIVVPIPPVASAASSPASALAAAENGGFQRVRHLSVVGENIKSLQGPCHLPILSIFKVIWFLISRSGLLKSRGISLLLPCLAL